MTAALPVLPDVAAALAWLRGHGARALRADSRDVRAGDAFLAWPGANTDGRRHVAAALAAGAVACLVEADGAPAELTGDPRVAGMADLKGVAGELAAQWWGDPSAQLSVLAVTGTNGKSSIAWWLAQALSHLGQRCAVIGTLGVGMPPLQTGDTGRIEATGLTTPDALRLQATLRELADTGHAACAMEASSIGIVEQRLAGTRIATALFSNFTRDHLDYHGSMQAYWQAKRALFDWPGLGAAVVNIDDEHGAALADELAVRRRPDLWTVSMAATADAASSARLCGGGLHYADGGLAFDLVEAGDPAVHQVRSRLIGDYNAHNLLLVLGGLRARGVALADAVAVVPRLTPVPGRMQRLGGRDGLPEVVVDYAHTPDALDKALSALRPFAQARSGRLWCVFGCGGDRDATKRPLMGGIAARLADIVVLTSDNPRHEKPVQIIDQIAAGLPDGAQVRREPDRALAIAQAVQQADGTDVLLLAGKGHEDYQEIAGQRRPFSDVGHALAALAQRPRAALQVTR
ncbi:MAG: UDP-N-acetylmuramoyl-L-alanyl-D-glutamate--2,6-diaminopimelate ligase [Aquabacterium sp.]